MVDLGVEALILAGGAARRMGGRDKPAVQVAGSTLLDHVLNAVGPDRRVVVVGPRRPTSRAVVWRQEIPPGGGPVSALAAGLPAVGAPLVLLLAADLPFLTAAILTHLVDAVGDADGALVVDADGRDQLLLGAWRTQALRAALPADPTGARLGAALRPLQPVRIASPAAEGQLPPWFDCDTEQDLTRARAAALSH